MKKSTVTGLSDEGFHYMSYTEWGSSSLELPALICAHGYTRNGRDFDKLAQFFALHGYHVFCPDVVGRGDSSWLTQAHNYNFNQYLRDMNVLIARTNTQHINWIGTSMGGIIGMMLAALPNSPIEHLVLNDVGPQIPLHALRKLAKHIGQNPEFKTKEEAKQFFKQSHAEFGNLDDEQWNLLTEHSIMQNSSNQFVSKTDPAIRHPKSFMHTVTDLFYHPHKALEGIFYDIEFWSIWKKITCPVLVIRGAHSEILTPFIIKKMIRTHNNTQVHEVQDAGHAPALLDETEQQLIYNWLNS